MITKINIVFYFVFRADPTEELRNVFIKVYPNGSLYWIPHQIFKSSCSIDVTNFPFDNQTCTMWFGSWTHAHSEIELDFVFAGGIDLSTFQ